MEAEAAEVTDAFMTKVSPEPNTSCWLWLGDLGSLGEGTLELAGVIWSATALAWRRAHGDIPGGHSVQPTCGVSSCVNPSHLALKRQS